MKPSVYPDTVRQGGRGRLGRGLDSVLLATMGWLPTRLGLAVISLFGFINLYAVRVNLSVIIVAMVEHRDNNNTNNTFTTPCTTNTITTTTTIADNDTFSLAASTISPTIQDADVMYWSDTVQGFVLGSFYYGYALTQILGGRAAEVYGTRLVFGGCVLAGGLASMLIPTVSRIHYGLLIALRVIQGACQGASWPSMHVLVSHWIPPLERPRFIAYVYFASNLSISLTFPLCGFITAQHGWPAAFYVTGALSILWSLFWFILVHDSPVSHPRIKESERAYIMCKVEESGTQQQQEDDGRLLGQKRNPPPVPWLELLTSLPAWATIIHSIGHNWGIGLFLTTLPTFLNNILGFSLKENTLTSGLPFLSRYVGALVWSSLTDFCTSRGHISVHASRRIACIISMWIPAVCLVCLAYNGCGRVSAIAIICAALFCNGAVSSSYIVNHTDITPNFSGTLFGVDNTFGSVISFIVPVMVGVITDGQQTLGQWRKVFWTCVPMYAVGGLFFLLFSSVTPQPWNTPKLPHHPNTDRPLDKSDSDTSHKEDNFLSVA